jgi:V-type H+-transporting ATPase subunit d
MNAAMNFNIDIGFLEGVVRGFRAGILTQTQYLNLTQCETLDGGRVAGVDRGDAR